MVLMIAELSPLERTVRTPALDASAASCSEAYMVNMTVGILGAMTAILRAAWRPSMTGMTRSITMMSGVSFMALSMASCPLEASPHTSQPGFLSSRLRIDLRMSGLSSAMRMRMGRGGF